MVFDRRKCVDQVKNDIACDDVGSGHSRLAQVSCRDSATRRDFLLLWYRFEFLGRAAAEEPYTAARNLLHRAAPVQPLRHREAAPNRFPPRRRTPGKAVEIESEAIADIHAGSCFSDQLPAEFQTRNDFAFVPPASQLSGHVDAIARFRAAAAAEPSLSQPSAQHDVGDQLTWHARYRRPRASSWSGAASLFTPR